MRRPVKFFLMVLAAAIIAFVLNSQGLLGVLPGFVLFLSVLYVVVGLIVRSCASVEFYWFFNPENTYSEVVSKENESVDITKGGGNIIKVVHELAGKHLVTAGLSKMDWYFEDGPENYGLLHELYGVHHKGLFTSLRTNLIKSARYGRPELDKSKENEDEGKTVREKDDKADYRIYAEDQRTKFVFFSSQQAVEVKSAETQGTYKLNLKFNIIFERIFPVRSVVRVADAQATLSEMVEAVTIAETGQHPPEYYLGGTAKAKNDLAKKIEGISAVTLQELGIFISKVTFFSVDPDEKERTLRALLELSATTQRQKDAELLAANKDKEIKKARAQGDAQAVKISARAARDARKYDNEASADYVETVLKPIAETPNGASIEWAHAIRDNDTITVFAPGGPALNQMLPSELVGKPPRKPIGFEQSSQKPDSKESAKV